MTQKEYDAQMVAIKEAQRIAEKPFHDTIAECRMKEQELWTRIAEMKLEINRLEAKRKEAGVKCAQVRDEFHAKKNSLAVNNPKSSMKEEVA